MENRKTVRHKSIPHMIPRRWFRIIPVALIMYTISYVDRTNVSLALDPKISTMMHDLVMDDRMKGRAAGVFFLGYVESPDKRHRGFLLSVIPIFALFLLALAGVVRAGMAN